MQILGLSSCTWSSWI